jgi:Fructose-bisphosphate aldolase class-II
MTNTESARVLYARTREERFAIGAFNVDNQETLIAIVRAAATRKSPVLVEASHGEVEMIGLRNFRAMVDSYKAEFGIEMYINLDHSPSVKTAKAAIDAGFEFIHIDLSQAKPDANNEEIITATREVVEYAKTTAHVWRVNRITSVAAPTSMPRASITPRFARRLRHRTARGPSWRRLVSIPSPWPLATCMACTRCPNIST